VIEGPEGVESIIAVASKERLPELDDEGKDIVTKVVEIHIEEPEPAKLRIISTPKNCRIYITDVDTGEEEYIGKSPRTIGIRPGQYRVRIKKFGYRTLIRKIWLDPGERRRVFVKLIPY
jgi:hypothetical protein